MEGHHLTIHIFHHDKEGLRCAVELFFPSKVRYQEAMGETVHQASSLRDFDGLMSSPISGGV